MQLNVGLGPQLCDPPGMFQKAGADGIIPEFISRPDRIGQHREETAIRRGKFQIIVAQMQVFRMRCLKVLLGFEQAGHGRAPSDPFLRAGRGQIGPRRRAQLRRAREFQKSPRQTI
ncbi:hypothetical protein [Pseudogemmobacter humi]|uniref:hypothetical protein n=1 Tax=Pseudogemmobacter humi TaxID=2483812 RepID=UPI001356C199|nr:hypothetical protein [Pseudogemmobacter humi]